MIYKQIFRTLAGAQKRADFETDHCNGKFRFYPRRYLSGERDFLYYDPYFAKAYYWRIERVKT